MTRLEYYENHKHCPRCNLDNISQTYVGFVFDRSNPLAYKDKNKCSC